ncbi:uroporphyrinogen-III synthase [Paenibacillus crassostreae]|uniref:Uroporphyrinogen-III synthase n=1 Tax=Paenibacillus crassostreae TaxID=1763538 RepID=A0A162KSZ6_9BACL|nr:uroporphyrinogen-III synthase [Paenibacillus crassostreae]AOZ93145.1 uroporphyrinogen-III synthase [Paenibacillus crassostreae]OAB71765.1 uroporphyrinogen-III synthase [Paenibacillus crassostreae]
MAQNMKGKTVAIAASRKVDEMSKLVENMGGTPVHRPAQGTVFLDDEKLREGLLSWIQNPPQWVILTTGMGLEAIFNVAEDMGVAEKLLDILSKSSIAARGYKTVNALKKRQLSPIVRDDDGSSAGLIRSFQTHHLSGANIILQLHGESAPKLTKWLQEQGAIVTPLLPYRHVQPEEQHLEQLLNDIIQANVDAVTFTSAPQFHFLVEYAHKQDKMKELLKAFAGPVVAVAVGKVTAQVLLEEGVERVIAPEEERMGSMMVTLGRYFVSQVNNEIAASGEPNKL